ncbi:AFG3-like protein 2 [Bonamia ostreae]|uniref:AFG3-like protein 2 n=1 Tax=Bonamia ostreae TaxID=126728 RepID=A0ABV2APZ5_9EUKA
MISKKDKIKALADKLIERETLSHDEIVDILGPKPHQNEDYQKYIKSTKFE